MSSPFGFSKVNSVLNVKRVYMFRLFSAVDSLWQYYLCYRQLYAKGFPFGSKLYYRFAWNIK